MSRRSVTGVMTASDMERYDLTNPLTIDDLSDDDKECLLDVLRRAYRETIETLGMIHECAPISLSGTAKMHKATAMALEWMARMYERHEQRPAHDQTGRDGDADSWEKLEYDATLHPFVYWQRQGKYMVMGGRDDDGISAEMVEPMIADIIRRAKKLAWVE